MPYVFAQERPDYSDLASGGVLYSAAGRPAFPVRLASEMFQRCQALRAANGQAGASVLYDPCCGAGYLLTVLGFRHRPALRALIGSDVDTAAVALAGQNLALLSGAGLDRRTSEIAAMGAQFGKDSHREALASAQRLRAQLVSDTGAPPLTTAVFQADALDGQALRAGLQGTLVDIVIADVPYGQHAHWQQADSGAPDPLGQMLEALVSVIGPASLVAVATDKGQKATHVAYQRVEQFQVGKRRVVILKPVG